MTFELDRDARGFMKSTFEEGVWWPWRTFQDVCARCEREAGSHGGLRPHKTSESGCEGFLLGGEKQLEGHQLVSEEILGRAGGSSVKLAQLAFTELMVELKPALRRAVEVLDGALWLTTPGACTTIEKPPVGRHTRLCSQCFELEHECHCPGKRIDGWHVRRWDGVERFEPLEQHFVERVEGAVLGAVETALEELLLGPWRE